MKQECKMLFVACAADILLPAQYLACVRQLQNGQTDSPLLQRLKSYHDTQNINGFYAEQRIADIANGYFTIAVVVLHADKVDGPINDIIIATEFPNFGGGEPYKVVDIKTGEVYFPFEYTPKAAPETPKAKPRRAARAGKPKAP